MVYSLQWILETETFFAISLQLLLLLLILHLSRCFDPFPDAEVHDCEDKQHAECELPANPSQVIQSLGSVYLENVAAETERKWTLELTLDANSGQKEGQGCGMRTQDAVTLLGYAGVDLSRHLDERPSGNTRNASCHPALHDGRKVDVTIKK